MYETKLPSAKSLVGVPLAIYNGVISVDNQHDEKPNNVDAMISMIST
jgi:hypothetical protein